MRTVTALFLAAGAVVFTAVRAGGDPAVLTLTARVVRGAGKVSPDLEAGSFELLDEKERKELFRHVDARPGSESVARVPAGAPGGPACRFSVSDLDRYSYIQDYDVEVGMGGTEVRGPIRQSVRSGLILDVAATRAPDGETVTFEVRLTLAALVRPVATFTTTLGGGPPVILELPELNVTWKRETIPVPVGKTAVYRAFADTLLLLGSETDTRKAEEPDGPPTSPDRHR